MPENSLEILSNTCLYNIFETYPSYRGCLLAVNVRIYLETLLMKQVINVLKLPGIDHICQKLGTSHYLTVKPQKP